MAQQRDYHSPEKQARNAGKRAPGSSQPHPGFESEPPAEVTNRDHPTAPGIRQPVPGAGIFPIGPEPASSVHHPGQAEPGTPGAAPGATRISTTDAARGAADPRDRAEGRRAGVGHAPESPSADSDSSLGADTAGEPGPTAAEPVPAIVYNPNFTAANRAGDITHPGGSDRRGDPDPHFPPPGRAGHRLPERVGEVMTANVECCTPDTELYYVARMMDDRDVGTIPVVASTEEMRPVVGIITDRDIVVRIIAKREDPHAMRASDCMSVNVMTVTPETSIEECMARMEQRQVRRAVVVDQEGRCTGILAQADLARLLPRDATGELVRDVSQPSQPGG